MFMFYPFVSSAFIILVSSEYRGTLSWGQSGRDCKLTTNLQLVPRSRKHANIHSLMRLHDVVLTKLSTGTTSPFYKFVIIIIINIISV
jgi:hypothetical protein